MHASLLILAITVSRKYMRPLSSHDGELMGLLRILAIIALKWSFRFVNFQGNLFNYEMKSRGFTKWKLLYWIGFYIKILKLYVDILYLGYIFQYYFYHLFSTNKANGRDEKNA